MANTILITANWRTGALSQQTISRQYDNNRYVVQFVGYPEASEGNELDYYLLVWMSSAPGEKPDEIAPIQLASDQWYISNVFTQQTQQIKFQMCALNTAGTFEAHSPIFTGFVRNSLEHDGTAQDIDVSTLFDAYREYLNELIIRSGAVVIDSVPTQGSSNAVQSGGVYDEITSLKKDLNDKVDYLSKTTDTITTETQLAFPNVDKNLDTNGEVVDGTGYAVTDYIPLDGVTGIYRTGTTTKFYMWRYAFYDANYNFLSLSELTTDYEIVEYNGKQVTWLTLNENASFVRIVWDMVRPYTYYVVQPAYVVTAYTLPDIIIKGKNVYNELLKSPLLYGKTIANFGDSVFGNKRPPNDISTALADITGATVYNLGFGGCRMSQHNANWDAFSMYRLADAIATGDFSIQNAVDVDNVSGMPSYFKETRTLLESIDFSEVDIITIAYGTNDFTASVALDNANNPKDTTTFCGALRYSLETILTAYPQLHIFVCTPTWRFWLDNGTFLYDSDTHEINGKLLTDFVESVKTVSNAYHVKSIDNYYDLGINQYNRSHWFPTGDGTHHNKDGGVLIAQHMATELF